MIEEVSLPGYFVIASHARFPDPDDPRNAIFIGNVDQQMNVVGHENGNFAVPSLPVVIKTDGLEECGADLGMAEMILAARISAKCEKELGAGVDPGGDFVVETFSWINIEFR